MDRCSGQGAAAVDRWGLRGAVAAGRWAREAVRVHCLGQRAAGMDHRARPGVVAVGRSQCQIGSAKGRSAFHLVGDQRACR